MNNTLRNAFAALAVVGILALGACKTTDESMDEPSASPAESTTPATPTDTTAPSDTTTTPPTTEPPPSGTP